MYLAHYPRLPFCGLIYIQLIHLWNNSSNERAILYKSNQIPPKWDSKNLVGLQNKKNPFSGYCPFVVTKWNPKIYPENDEDDGDMGLELALHDGQTAVDVDFADHHADVRHLKTTTTSKRIVYLLVLFIHKPNRVVIFSTKICTACLCLFKKLFQG